MILSKRIAALAVVLAGIAWLAPGLAVADEIVVRDLATGETSSVRCWGVTSETWSEVKYKDRERSAEKTVPTNTVVRIVRSDKSTNANNLRQAIADLNRGNHKEAAQALEAITGGGWKVDLDTGARKYKSFSENDPTGRNKRPAWVSEYAHFYFAKAMYLHGKANKDRSAIEDAWLAIDDVKVPKGDGKATTGGFLGRFANGNSRFYPEAMWIKANALVSLARYDDAAAVFDELHNAAIRVSLDPRWAYEGKIGPGVIAEAQGDLTAAVDGYTGARTTMDVLMPEETRAWVLGEYGRYYSQAHMRIAAVLLKDAEKRKASSAFQRLRSHIRKGMAAQLRKNAQNRGFSEAAISALINGARDPAVQAVGFNGIGLAYLNEPTPRYEDALLAFKAVTVKYFQVSEQHARALYYLAEAAKGASKGSKGAVKDMYDGMADAAIRMLRDQHPGSVWANK